MSDLREESEQLLDNIINSVYFMRGSIDYFDFFELTYLERQKINKFLDQRMNNEMKKPPMINRVY